MPVDTQDVIELVSRITCEDGIKVTVKQSLKAGFMAGGGAMVGGLLGGPVGVLIGGVAASCMAAVSLSGTFQPLHEVILQLPERQKRDLADAVRRIVENIDLYDITALTALVMGNTSLRMQIIKAVVAFAQSELRLEIAD